MYIYIHILVQFVDTTHVAFWLCMYLVCCIVLQIFIYVYGYNLFVILYCMIVSCWYGWHGIDFSLSVLLLGVIVSSKDNDCKIIHSSDSFVSSGVDCWLLYVYVYEYEYEYEYEYGCISTIRWYYSCCLFVVYVHIVCCIVLQLIMYCMVERWERYNNPPSSAIVDTFNMFERRVV